MKAKPPDVRRIGSDPDALEAFYIEHVADIRRFIARRTSDPFHAADLTADVFLAAIEACEGYDPRRGRPGAWLVGIARNVLLADGRRRAREVQVVARVSGRALLTEDAVSRAEEIIDGQRAARDLLTGLDDLPAGERAVLELVAFDGLTVTEAAEVLGVQPGTARVRLHRARHHIREIANTPAVAHLEEIR